MGALGGGRKDKLSQGSLVAAPGITRSWMELPLKVSHYFNKKICETQQTAYLTKLLVRLEDRSETQGIFSFFLN